MARGVGAIVFVIGLAALGGCGGRANLPRNVRESAHRDFPNCRGRDIEGEVLDVAQNTYLVNACGVQVVYVCPTGAHSRWRRCERVDPTAGGAVGH